MACDGMLSIRVVLAFSDTQHQVHFQLPAGTNARQAVIRAVDEGLDLDAVGGAHDVPIGVFGEQVNDDYVLLNNDRVEIYRPLIQSPMELRRQRAAAQKGQRGGTA
ncbi:MAG: RnfH family protein [Granulosicoccaceae bacterium]